MQLRHRNHFTTIRTEGSILPADLLQRINDRDAQLKGLTPDDYHLAGGLKLNEAINQSWNRLLGAWAVFQNALNSLPAHDAGTTLTREKWLLVLFQELGYGRLPIARGLEVEGKSYPVSHLWQQTAIHLVSARVDLDTRTAGVTGASRISPHGLVQELLNRSAAHLWGFVSNGLRLRILRDNVSLTRQAYVEFDLEAMMTGELYPDFALLWLLCHESRVNAEKPSDCWLENWSKAAQEQGTRALEQLRKGVEDAIKALGRGFLIHPANQTLLGKLRAGTLDKQDYYRQLLRLVYRLLFLFVAEDRELLSTPEADEKARERYTRFYSVSRLRRLAERRLGTRHNDLYHGLRLVMQKLGNGGCAELGLPALGSFLFSNEAIADLNGCEIANSDLLETIRALAFITDGHGRRTVDYRNLRSEELGSVYEALLELHPVINAEARQFHLDSASGNERKTTGSYYTPDSLVQCLLDSALDPVAAEARKQPDAEAALLRLKVVDPACGSGHFLIAAAHRLSKHLASVRTGDDEPAPEAVRRALRDVIGHCIYGVDINPMAVELCKVSLWMEALEPGKPLTFLEHRIQCGNALIGATPALLKNGIPDEAFKPIEGDDRGYCAEYRKQNRKERLGFQRLPFDAEIKLGNLAASIVELDAIDDGDIAGVRDKQQRYEALVKSSGYLYGQFLADAWCAAFVWKKTREFPYPITEAIFREIENKPFRHGSLHGGEWLQREVQRLAAQYQFFHWHLVFPDVFRLPVNDEESENEQVGWSGGFDVVLGNPPWEMVTAGQGEEAEGVFARTQHVYNSNQYEVLSGRRDLYKLFLVQGKDVVSRNGFLAMLCPLGVFIEDDSSDFRRQLFNRGSITELHHFQNNRKSFFPHVHASYRFCGITYSPSQDYPHRFSTIAKSPDEILSQLVIEIRRSDFDSQFGITRAAVLYSEREYAKIHQAVIKQVQTRKKLRFQIYAEFHSSTDKQLVRSERAEAVDWVLLKNRNIHQFDYRFSPPEAFVIQADVIQRLRRKDLSPEIWLRTPRLVFRDIARNDDERTLIACLAPPGNLSSYDTPMVVPPQTATALRTALSFYCGLFNCFLADFLIRPFVDKHIKGYVLNRVPWIHLDYINSKDVWSADWLLTRVLELIYTNDDFESFAEDCGYTGEPFRWDEARRFLLRAELDAAYFHLYGIAREDVDYILDTFPIVRRKDEKEHGEYRTKRVIMEIYDALQQAITSGQPYQTRLDPPPAHGWTPPEIQGEGGKMNDEVPTPGDPPFQLQMQDARPQLTLFDGVE